MGCVLDIPAERLALRVALALQAACLRSRRGRRIGWKYVVAIEILATWDQSVRLPRYPGRRTRANASSISQEGAEQRTCMTAWHQCSAATAPAGGSKRASQSHGAAMACTRDSECGARKTPAVAERPGDGGPAPVPTRVDGDQRTIPACLRAHSSNSAAHPAFAPRRALGERSRRAERSGGPTKLPQL